MFENERKQRREKNGQKEKKPPTSNKKKKVELDWPETAACPVHPDLPHTWGDCFSNPKNRNKKRRTDYKPKTYGNDDTKVKKKSKDSFATIPRKERFQKSSDDDNSKRMKRLRIQESDTEFRSPSQDSLETHQFKFRKLQVSIISEHENRLDQLK